MEAPINRLQHFPVSFFSVILGMSGLTIAAQRAEKMLSIPITVSPLFLGITLFLFAIISITYLFKIFRFRSDVQAEYFHPVKINFFPASSISMLLLSIALIPYNQTIAQFFWAIGAAAHILFTLSIFSIWIRHNKFNVKHKNPAWFIPVVGNMVAPVAGAELFPKEISWFFFSVGFILWIVLFTIFMYRAFFHEPIEEKLMPTFFILIAPPAIGFIAYYKLTGHISEFNHVLYFFALFLTLLLFFNANMFLKIKYYLSWWAYSFPIAAITLATTLMYHHTEMFFYKYLSYFFIVILNALVLYLLIKTLKCISRKAICIEE